MPTPTETLGADLTDADLTDADLDALAAAGQQGSNLAPVTQPPRKSGNPFGDFWDMMKP